jgi:hypothetical protein
MMGGESKPQWFCRQCGAECEVMPDGKPGRAISSRPSTMLDAGKVKEWIAENAGTHYVPKFELLEAINSGNLNAGAIIE